jgi:RNA polymerase sigma factor (sigma-70 family)
MKSSQEIQQTAAHLFRHESGKMIAVLVKLFGLNQVQIAEDIVQETLIAAFENWKLQGLPENPRAWLYRVAKNKTIDFLRRERNFKDVIAPNISFELTQNQVKNGWLDDFFLENEINDAQLRMMFACCHPELPVEQQMALMLRTLCGLNAKEIAAAFLQSEDTIGKRIFRAKEKIRQAKLSLDVPTGEDLIQRIDAVLQAIYLLFNEGYKSSTENTVIRRDLCSEAIRLCALLAENKLGNLPKTHALLALMCFQSARFEARLDTEGEIILLENQDRSLWNKNLISLGYQHFSQASKGSEISEYHLEAAIASYHTSAPTFEQTNWKAIFYCYDLLLKINESPVIALNRAIALGYADGAKAGIAALLKITGLEKNVLYYAALGDFLGKEKKNKEAIVQYGIALKFVQLPTEKKIIEQKIRNLTCF